jgi:hypothetical protein
LVVVEERLNLDKEMMERILGSWRLDHLENHLLSKMIYLIIDEYLEVTCVV